jgi:hypothetical protein
MGETVCVARQAAWLGWLPIPALILASYGSTVAVNGKWVSMLPVASGGDGWLEPVESPFRSALRARLRLAVAAAAPGISISAGLAMAVIQRIFEAGLALESAASLLDGPLATVVLRALDGLDQAVHDIRSAVFAPRSRPVTSPPQHAH